MSTPLDLEADEARVLGVLIEKELTTPEQYPLSLNALAAGCSQKSNRYPVCVYSESQIRSTLAKLQIRQLVGGVHPAGSRVERFRHNALEVLNLTRAELAVLAELLLRGAQAPGELRARAARMAEIPNQETLKVLLGPLERRQLVCEIDPQPGSRVRRIALVGTESSRVNEPVSPSPSAPAAAQPRPGTGTLEQRVATLEAQLLTLRAQLEGLAGKLGEPLDDPREAPAEADAGSSS